jgi:2-dehydro-3-deoxyphosphogalactonate aldolase
MQAAIPESMPIIAILRGLTPERAVAVGDAIFAAGIGTLEVPLNSPAPLDSIRALSERFAGRALIGAGTVLTVDEVRRTHEAGGRLIVAPNCDTAVIRFALSLGMTVLPGVATATEAFSAIAAGARRLKLFPAVTYGVRHLKALKDVLPADVSVYPVGGIGVMDISEWLKGGAAGFGFGSELFRPTYSIEEIAQRAQRIVDTFAAHQAA